MTTLTDAIVAYVEAYAEWITAEPDDERGSGLTRDRDAALERLRKACAPLEPIVALMGGEVKP